MGVDYTAKVFYGIKVHDTEEETGLYFDNEEKLDELLDFDNKEFSWSEIEYDEEKEFSKLFEWFEKFGLTIVVAGNYCYSLVGRHYIAVKDSLTECQLYQDKLVPEVKPEWKTTLIKALDELGLKYNPSDLGYKVVVEVW